eukprot:s5744_g4.t1
MAAWLSTHKRDPASFREMLRLASLKLKPESVPRHPGHRDVAAYFPHGETAVTNILQGQLAFLSHVKLYEENNAGMHLLQGNLVWKYEFLCCFLGCLSAEGLHTLANEITQVAQLRHDHASWAVRQSKALSEILRHNERTQLGSYMEISLEGLQRFKTLPLEWHPTK